MAVEDLLDLHRGDVLSTGDDDVLAPVPDLDVAVGVHHGQVPGQEAPVAGDLSCRLVVTVVAEHDVVAADRDVADRLAVGRHILPVVVENPQRPGDDVGRTLPGAQRGLPVRLEVIPLRLPFVDGQRTVGLGEPVQMGDGEAQLAQAREQGGRRRRAAGVHVHLVIQRPGRVVFGDHGEHGRRGAEVGDSIGAQQPPDLARVDGAQADMGTAGRGDGPGEAPAVAVEHRQRPQVPGARPQAGVVRHRRGLQVRAPVVVHHALGPPGRPAGVVDGQELALVDLPGHRPSRIGVREPCLVAVTGPARYDQRQVQLCGQAAAEVGELVGRHQQ